MRIIAVFLLFCFAQGKAQLDNYFNVFMPNTEADMAVMKGSAQKTAIIFNGGLEWMEMSEEDSLQRIEQVKKYDNNGRLEEHIDLVEGVQRFYKYDDEGRVIKYSEKSVYSSGASRLDFDISYNKKGKITAVKNSATDAEARTASYYEKGEKLIISTLDGFTDEIYFKDGRIVKVIGKASEIEKYLAEYVYDDKGRVIQQTGHWESMDEVQNYTITTGYNTHGYKQSKIVETWPPNRPAEKQRTETTYFYTKDNILQSEITDRPGGSQVINNYEFDSQRRLAKTDWFEDEMYMVTLYTRYY